MAKEIKEELMKQAKDGLDVLADIPRFAESGFESIPKDDLARLKWYGVYTQRPESDGYFLLRIKVPGGRLTSERLREIGAITKEYARNIGDISTRQDIQVHWLRIENVPDIFRRLYEQLGMNQSFSCGDTPRNVTCCPLTGVTRDELFDVGPIAESIADMYYRGGKEFSNLPRKLKTSIGSCPLHCHTPQINDMGFFGVQRKRSHGTEQGLGLLVGGGLRDTPHFAQSLRVFLPPRVELITDICRNIAHIFRDCQELRQGRLRARLKFYVARIGWEAFRDQLEHYLGYKLEHDDSIVYPVGASHSDHIGIGRQKDGRCFVGVPIERGRFSGDDMIRLANLAEEYASDGQGRLVTTIKQNIILKNIPSTRVDDLMRQLDAAGLSPHRHPLRGSLISCTGIEFCKLAVSETKARAKAVLNHLEQQLPALTEPLFIAITGCPNSCAHYQIADIGLHGVPTQYKGEKVEGFHVLLGSKLGEEPRFADFVTNSDGKRLKIPTVLVHESIERLIRAWQQAGGGPFGDWARRQDNAYLAALLYPEAATATGES